MRALLLAFAILLFSVGTPWLAAASYGGVFQGTGWKLLRVESADEVEINFRYRRGEGYAVDLQAVYAADGTFLRGFPGALPDVGPGLYADVAPLPAAELAPNPPHTSNYGGGWITVPPGVHYVVIGVAGELSHWTLDAPNSVLLDEGPTNFAFVSQMEGGIGVEANAWFVSASVAQERRLPFDVQGTLIGVFGPPAVPTVHESGNATLLLPDGARLDCPCTYSMRHFPDDMPGTYVYEDDRTMATRYRYPVAVWADVPLPFA